RGDLRSVRRPQRLGGRGAGLSRPGRPLPCAGGHRDRCDRRRRRRADRHRRGRAIARGPRLVARRPRARASRRRGGAGGRARVGRHGAGDRRARGVGSPAEIGARDRMRPESVGRRGLAGARRRGLVGVLERGWSGEAGSIPWPGAITPAAAVYAAASARARARAADARRSLPGLYVISIGNLTVGGTGKTALARWLALQAMELGASPAVLLRGHGAIRRDRDTDVVPDLDGYPLGQAVDRLGDEAAAHRAALPRGATVVVDRDRYRGARAAKSGYGARVAILDDGWEQGGLRWDELWVTLDPDRPQGNGLVLPAGPLRRPASTLREASVIAFVMEEAGVELPAATKSWVAARAPGVPM